MTTETILFAKFGPGLADSDLAARYPDPEYPTAEVDMPYVLADSFGAGLQELQSLDLTGLGLTGTVPDSLRQ